MLTLVPSDVSGIFLNPQIYFAANFNVLTPYVAYSNRICRARIRSGIQDSSVNIFNMQNMCKSQIHVRIGRQVHQSLRTQLCSFSLLLFIISLIFICNRAGFCSIRENIRASLVEPWFVFWRDQSSTDIFPNRAKTCTITCLSSLTEKCILKTKLSRLEKLHSCVNARTHQFPALGRPHSFER